MPKDPAGLKIKLNNYVKEFGSDVFSSDDSILFCKLCETSVNCAKKCHVSQHVQTAKHKSALRRATKIGEPKATLISSYAVSHRQSQFSLDLCRAFIDAGIPLFKIENFTLKNFLQKYTREQVPSESTLRKNYVDVCYSETVNRIRDAVSGKKIWISVDETQDSCRRSIANVVIGTMEFDKPSQIFLLSCEQLDKTNSSTVAQLFTSALNLLWPDGVKYEDVLLFTSDAAPYMKKAGKVLKVLFPNLLHVTCLAHALHRICEEIRGIFSEVDSLISNTKKIFLKSPNRIQLFKEMAPELALPPQPVLTRWGTWLSAALYYASNFNKIQTIVNALCDDDASSIAIVKKLLLKGTLRNDLAFIAANYSSLPEAIICLEERNKSLVNSLQVVDDIVKKIQVVPGVTGRTVREKCEQVLKQNEDFQKLKGIGMILKGENNISTAIHPETVALFKYAPVTSVEVERSFSVLKNVLSDRRHNLKVENLKKYLVVMCNQSNTNS